MNYLAHIYLSGDNDLVTIGNFIADGIRGKQYKQYRPELQVGILLHREIDTFTDGHPIVRQSTKRLHANYSHYSGVIVDILYDHFLAKNWARYNPTPLALYVENFYDTLETHHDLLPLRIQRLIPHMMADNWLLSYANIDGIQRVLDGMNRRTKHVSGMHTATNELIAFYAEFENEFTMYFEELQLFSRQKLTELSKTYSL